VGRPLLTVSATATAKCNIDNPMKTKPTVLALRLFLFFMAFI
jgi:hypothetical protein